MLLKERKVSFKRRKWSKLCPGSANTLLGYPQHKIGMFKHKSGKLQLDYLTCHETVWAMWCYEQTFNSSGLACFQSSLLRQSYHFHKTFGYFLECGVLLELFLTAETLQLGITQPSESYSGNQKSWKRPILLNVSRGTRQPSDPCCSSFRAVILLKIWVYGLEGCYPQLEWPLW